MPIREDLVASAAKFLQDPTVASSPIENRIAFLQAKNLTQEEVTAALARAGPEPSTPQSYPPPAPASSSSSSPAYPAAAAQAQPYYGQYPPQYPPYAWQAPPPEVPRRDWRDWFIMATVMSGVGYGLYTLGRRYVYPLVAPPTPERLEQDKKTIDEQFERAFGLVDQLAKDTETLKAAEQARTERLDTALAELETVMADLKSANRRREDDAQRVRDDVQGLKDAVPRAMTAQKDMTEMRLKEVNAELKSLKTLITQRMNPGGSGNGNGSGSGNGVGIGAGNGVSSSHYGYSARLANGDNAATSSSAAAAPAPSSSSPAIGSAVYGLATAPTAAAADEPKPSAASQSHGTSPFNGMPQSRASIPAWQLAMASKSSGASSGSNGASADAEGSGSGSSSAQGSPSAS